MTSTIDEAVAEGSLTSWVGMTYVTASSRGVQRVSLPRWSDHMQPAAPDASDIVMQGSASVAAERQLRLALDALAEYFAGARRTWDVALDLRGPAFYRRVWAEVARVPYGETRSYADIARAVGAPAATRAVGVANGANPAAPLVPCHRIVGSDGLLHGYGPGLALKQRLLVMEDALPSSPEAYPSWAARLSARFASHDIYLGIRGAGIYCRLDCPRPVRQRYLPARVFRDAAEAVDAGFGPCPTCQPHA